MPECALCISATINTEKIQKCVLTHIYEGNIFLNLEVFMCSSDPERSENAIWPLRGEECTTLAHWPPGTVNFK